jgi:hypothetical protein
MRALPKDIDAIPAPSRLGRAARKKGPPIKATGAAGAINLGGQVKLSRCSGRKISCTMGFAGKPAAAGQRRNQNLHALLPMDRVTRFSLAQPEAGRLAGAPPTIMPTMLREFPTLPEHAEQGEGSRPFTVLAENDERNKPASRPARHFDRAHCAGTKHFPAGRFAAINVLAVVSPAMSNWRLIQKKDECATLDVGVPEKIMSEGKGKVT